MKLLHNILIVLLSFYVLLFNKENILKADTIWRDKNIYSAYDTIKVGDILIVTITDLSQMRFTVTLSNNDDFTITSNPDGNLTPFLPPVNASKQSRKNNSTNFQQRNSFSLQIPVTVQQKLDNGNVRVVGSKTFSFNGITTVFTINGIVNPALIKGNGVYSHDIANLVVQIQGIREGIRITREPLKEGESATAQLTEAEKQQIIVQYLQKVLSELLQQ